MSLRLTIHGNVPLRGSISVSPSQYITDKLSILSLLGSEGSLLTDAPIRNTPGPLFDLIEFLGAHIEYDKTNVHIYPKPFITPSIPDGSMIRPELLFLLFFVVLAKSGRAALSIQEYPLIAKKVSSFFSSHPQLSFTVEEQQNFLVVTRLISDFTRIAVNPSDSLDDVLAMVVLGSLSRGRYKITLSSSVDRLQKELKFITQLGAVLKISDQEIEIEGLESLSGAEEIITEDVEEAIFLAIAGVLSNGNVELKVHDQSLYLPIMNKLGQAGFEYKFNHNRMFVWSDESTLWNPISLTFTPQSAISERLRSSLIVAMSQFSGESKIIDLVSPTGIDFMETLKVAGIECVPHLESEFNDNEPKALREVSIIGPTKLQAGFFDLLNARTTLAPIMIGLLAEGETEIRGGEFLFFKYPYLISQLQSLGAKIKVVHE